MMRAGLPYACPGQTVGLFGGSFDPPHAGHVHVSREALKRFGLDRVWWLVSPGNPLKREGPAPLERRMQAARALVTPYTRRGTRGTTCSRSPASTVRHTCPSVAVARR